MLRLWWFLFLSIGNTYALISDAYDTIYGACQVEDIIFFFVFLILTPYVYAEVIKSIKLLKV